MTPKEKRINLSFLFLNDEISLYSKKSQTFIKTLGDTLNSARAVDDFFNKNKLSKLDSLILVNKDKRLVLIPNEFFDEKHLLNYSNTNFKVLDDEQLVYNTIEKQGFTAVYPLTKREIAFKFFLKQQSLNNNYYALLITYLCKYNSDKIYAYIHHNKNDFQLIIINEKNKLILYNSFLYSSEMEFTYYLLFTLKQYAIDFQNTPICFLTPIDISSSLCRELAKFTDQVIKFKKNKPNEKDTIQEIIQAYSVR